MKEPWLAVLLSFLFPGIGLFYVGKRVVGVSAFLVINSMISWGAWSILSPSGQTLRGWILVALALTFQIGTMVISWHAARLENKSGPKKLGRKGRDPYLAILLSVVLPGLGHLYAGLHVLGLLFLACYILLVMEGPAGFSGIVVETLFLAIVLSHVSTSRGSLSSRRRWVLVTAIVALLFFTSTVHQFASHNLARMEFLTGQSNYPTLMEGDLVVVDLHAKADFRTSDFVVLSLAFPPDYQSRFVVKRVIAFEGDEVYIDSGSVYLNRERMMGQHFSRVQYTVDSTCVYGKLQNPYIVPKGYIFVLGDNPTHCTDSRQIGGIERGSVVGVVRKVIWPLQRIQNLDSYHGRLAMSLP